MTKASVDHPAFPQPADDSILLWRYLDDFKFLWLAKHERLYMPPVEKLGDPFEGTTPPGELKYWKGLIEKAKTKEQKKILEHNRNSLSTVAKEFRARYYVSCWHTNQFENRAMWDCYTSVRESVAIKTTYAALKECLPGYVFLGKVRYMDFLSDRFPGMNLFHYIMHKDFYYDFEKEVRAVAFVPAVTGVKRDHFLKSQFESDKTPKFEVHAPPLEISKLVKGIILHPEAPRGFVDEIVKLCRENGLPEPERSWQHRQPVF